MAAATTKKKFEFPSAVTTLAIVTFLVWFAALFIPAGKYTLDADGSPLPGSYEQVPSPLSFGESVQQLILAPINGIYGLLNADGRGGHRDGRPDVRPDRCDRLHHGHRGLHLGLASPPRVSRSPSRN
ncbi:MAG: hypothetical protein V9G10_05405 [Candidatus Nanopelagicales bacterium]